MHWILQDNLFNESAYQDLLDTLVRFELPHSIHKVIPFIGELTPEPELDTNRVICMGSYSLRHAARKYGWTPGVFDLEPFDFTVQMQHWGNHMLNADARVQRFQNINLKEPSFLRPIHDSKCFAGRVFSPDEFYAWQASVCQFGEDFGDSLTPETLIQVCSIKKIYAEYRFWIVNQQIVTACRYKLGDRIVYSPIVDRHVHWFAAQILRTSNLQTDITLSVDNRGWRPHDAFVLDICETEHGMKVVEINTINSAGFYAADIPALVNALETMYK
jgi:hypothetical protein